MVFQLKTVEPKERIGNQTIKRYDPAKTTYQRVLECKDISLDAKARLMNLYVQLNPAEFRCRIDQKAAKLWKMVVGLDT